MNLKEAITQVLTECGGITTIEEISRRIERGHLFLKADGTTPDPSYLLFGIKNYLNEFEVIVRLRR